MAKIKGTGRSDSLMGKFGQENDIRGGNGHDNITGREMNDALFGEGGNDNLYGGFGNDYLHGGYGVDWLYGEEGDDKLNTTTGKADYQPPNSDFEIMDGGDGFDNAHIDVRGATVYGAGARTLEIGAMQDGGYSFGIVSIHEERATIGIANVESFTLREDGPALYFVGNIGVPGAAISLSATAGDDVFCGGMEHSVVDLKAGNDTFIVSDGGDVVTLGAGADTLEFHSFYNGPRSATVLDFNVAEDTVNAQGWGVDKPLTVAEDASGTWLTAQDFTLHLVGVTGFQMPQDAVLV